MMKQTALAHGRGKMQLRLCQQMTELVCLVVVFSGVVLAQSISDPRSIALDEFQSEPPFLVRVDVNRPDRIYHSGDTIQVSVRSQRDGYLYLFYCDASQNVSCLFPNQIQSSNRITAGQTLLIPQQSSRFQLRVGAPYGPEVLKAIVTTQPLQTLELQALTKGDFTPVQPQRFKGVFVELRGTVSHDSASESPSTPETAPGTHRAWSEHSVELTTVAPEVDVPPRPGLTSMPQLAELANAPTSGSQPSLVSGTPATGAKRVGVFIGISQYLEPGIRSLAVAAQDAQAMADIMRQRGGLSESVLLVNEQATLSNIRRVIQEGLPATTRPGDLIVLYWSGHGGRTANLDGNEPDGFDEYLVPYDGRLQPAAAIRSTMLLDKTFGRWVQHLDGRKLVVILDACHSGGQSQGAIKAITGGNQGAPFRDFFFQTAWERTKDIGQRETAVLASSRASQLSFERRGRDLSVMTHFLIEKMTTTRGPLTLKEAAEYVMQRVPAFVQEQYPGTTQTPIFVNLTTPPVLLQP